ncbi:MAG: glycerophosphodiester phosphodiesterase family protein [Sulfitobacter sp.]
MSPKLPAEFLSAPLAHRALHDVTDSRPENSRAAIRAAIAAGYGIEIDVQLSADNQAMVFHDYALERLTTEKGAVRARAAGALSQIALTGGEEGVPDLRGILDLVDGRAALLIEIKDQDGGMGTDIGPLEQATATALMGYTGPVALMSFNPNSVALMAELLPNVPRGLVTSAYRYDAWPLPAATCDRLREIPDYDRCGASFVSHEVDDLYRNRIAQLRDAGAKILCWTVKSAAQEVAARRIADNITFECYLAEIPT